MADKTMKLSKYSEGYINLSAILSEKIKESIKELLFKESKKYYTRKEVCQLLNVSLPTLYQYIVGQNYGFKNQWTFFIRCLQYQPIYRKKGGAEIWHSLRNNRKRWRML